MNQVDKEKSVLERLVIFLGGTEPIRMTAQPLMVVKCSYDIHCQNDVRVMLPSAFEQALKCMKMHVLKEAVAVVPLVATFSSSYDLGSGDFMREFTQFRKELILSVSLSPRLLFFAPISAHDHVVFLDRSFGKYHLAFDTQLADQKVIDKVYVAEEESVCCTMMNSLQMDRIPERDIIRISGEFGLYKKKDCVQIKVFPKLQ
jgi:hypothetical protein